MSKSKQEHIDTITALIKDVKFAMLVTETDEGHLHACPMTTQTGIGFSDEIWFIGAKDSETVNDIGKREQINLSYACPKDGNYVSVTGRAQLVEDRAKLDEMWNDSYEAYFDGKDDPNIQLIKIQAHGAEYWVSDSKPVALFKLGKAAVTGEQAEDMGANYAVSFED